MKMSRRLIYLLLLSCGGNAQSNPPTTVFTDTPFNQASTPSEIGPQESRPAVDSEHLDLNVTNVSVTTFAMPSTQTAEIAPPTSTGWTYCSVLDFTIEVILTSVIVIFGCVGNALSFLSFWETRTKSASSVILMALSVFDTGTLIFIGLFMLVIPNICSHAGVCSHFMRYIFPYYLAHGLPLGSMFHTLSTWMVVLVAFHRYIAVCFPTKASRWSSIRMARLQLIIVIVAIVVFQSIRLGEYYVYMKPDGSGVALGQTYLGANTIYTTIYTLALYYIFVFAVPFVLLLFFTYKLGRGVYEAKLKREQMTRFKRDESDLTITLVSVVVMFLICQIPNPVRRYLTSITPKKARTCGTLYVSWMYFSNCMFLTNSAINVVLYSIFGRRFRKSLMRTLCKNRVGPMSNTGNESNRDNNVNTTNKNSTKPSNSTGENSNIR